MKCMNCESVEATFVCDRCKMVFCAKCDKEIHSLPVFKDHNRLETETEGLELCPAHNELELFFCNDCLECCCWKCVCMEQKHNGHKLVYYDTAYKERKDMFETRKAEIRSILALTQAVEAAAERGLSKWSDTCKALQQKINENFGRTAAVAAKHKEDMLMKIEGDCAANEKALSETATECRAAEEASRKVLAERERLGNNFSEIVANAGRIEKSIDVMTELNDRIFNKVLPESYTVKFVPKLQAPPAKRQKMEARQSSSSSSSSSLSLPGMLFADMEMLRMAMEKSRGSDGDGEYEKEDEDEDEDEDEKDVEMGPINRVVKWFGTVEKVANGNSFDKILKVKTVTNAEGKAVQDIGDTHIGLTWESVSSCYREYAKAGKLIFALKMRTIDNDNSIEKDLSAEAKEAALTTVYSGPDTEYRCEGLEEKKNYAFRLYALGGKGNGSEYCFWRTPEVAISLGSYQGKWRTDCPRVNVDAANPMIVNAGRGCRDTVIGDTPLTPGVVNRWKIRLVHSGNGLWEWLGVAPGDIDLSNTGNETRCGWYLNTLSTTLYCGPPFKWDSRRYGTNAECEIPKGSVVGLIMDMAAGTLAYTVNGKDYGVAYEGIPLDKPLFPAAIFNDSNQKIELLPWNADDTFVPEDSDDEISRSDSRNRYDDDDNDRYDDDNNSDNDGYDSG